MFEREREEEEGRERDRERENVVRECVLAPVCGCACGVCVDVHVCACLPCACMRAHKDFFLTLMTGDV